MLMNFCAYMASSKVKIYASVAAIFLTIAIYSSATAVDDISTKKNVFSYLPGSFYHLAEDSLLSEISVVQIAYLNNIRSFDGGGSITSSYGHECTLNKGHIIQIIDIWEQPAPRPSSLSFLIVKKDDLNLQINLYIPTCPVNMIVHIPIQLVQYHLSKFENKSIDLDELQALKEKEKTDKLLKLKESISDIETGNFKKKNIILE